MNEIRIKGTLKFNPKTFAKGVGIVVQPDGESSGVEMTAWTEDVPSACAALAAAGEGSKVTVQGKLVRKKDKMLGKVKDGALLSGDVWVLGVAVVNVRVDAVAAPPPPSNRQSTPSDEEIPF